MRPVPSHCLHSPPVRRDQPSRAPTPLRNSRSRSGPAPPGSSGGVSRPAPSRMPLEQLGQRVERAPPGAPAELIARPRGVHHGHGQRHVEPARLRRLEAQAEARRGRRAEQPRRHRHAAGAEQLLQPGAVDHRLGREVEGAGRVAHHGEPVRAARRRGSAAPGTRAAPSAGRTGSGPAAAARRAAAGRRTACGSRTRRRARRSVPAGAGPRARPGSCARSGRAAARPRPCPASRRSSRLRWWATSRPRAGPWARARRRPPTTRRRAPAPPPRPPRGTPARCRTR